MCIRGLSTAPERLVVGSPFLLNVKLACGASPVTGKWTGRELHFFRGPTASDGEQTWYALAGVDVETEPGSYAVELEATALDGQVIRATRQIKVGAANYRSSALRVAGNFVEPDAATQKQIAADKALKDRVFAQSAARPEWSGDFVPPVGSPSTDSFGTRRTFNGKLASLHRGMDFRAASGTPVLSSNSGRVVIASKLFFEGNLVVIDHGQGFMTLYMHLSEIDVAEGQNVHRGQRVGLSGASGRVTGPHLHFAVRWGDAYLDPARLFVLPLQGKP